MSTIIDIAYTRQTKPTHNWERRAGSDDSSLLAYAFTVTQPESGPEFPTWREAGR